MTHRAAPEAEWTRRRWLAALSFAGLGTLGADTAPAKPAADPAEVDAIRRRAKEARLPNFRTGESEHYFGIGDAPDNYRKEALDVCEAIAKTFRTHFLTKGLTIVMPPRKLAVVILADKRSYEAFTGEAVDDSEGGHYDVEANRLVTHDFRGGGGGAALKRELNTLALVHETTHQLTYNTGLLAREGDVPVAVSEGFATYGEIWRVSRPVMGKVNHPRLVVLKAPPAEGPVWVPVADLLTDDQLFYDRKTVQVALAESWLLIYDLLQTANGSKKLQNYLQGLRKRRDPGQRVTDAENAFGNLGRLDAELKRVATRLLR